MAKPWEKYQAAPAPQSTAGPWAKYADPVNLIRFSKVLLTKGAIKQFEEVLA